MIDVQKMNVQVELLGYNREKKKNMGMRYDGSMIYKLLWQLMLKVSEGDISLQLQWFMQFVPVIGNRELEGKAAKGRVSFGDDQWNIPAGVHATGGCCYGDQWAEIRRGFTWQRLIDDLEPVGLATNM